MMNLASKSAWPLASGSCGGKSVLIFCAKRTGLASPRFYLLPSTSTSIHTCAALSGFVKTDIQKWGWGYLNRQKELQRPISPHLTVYKPQLTWMVSGVFRIAGVVMGSVVACAAVTLMVAPFDFPQVVEFIRGLGLPSPILSAFKFVICWPIIFHYLNGIRFLGFDMAKGTDIGSVYKTGWLVVALSIILALLATFWPKSVESNEELKAKLLSK